MTDTARPSQSLRQLVRGLILDGTQEIRLSVPGLHHLERAFAIIADRMEQLEAAHDLAIWRLGVSRDAVRNMAAATRAACAEPARDLRDDAAAERIAAEEAAEMATERAARLRRRAAQIEAADAKIVALPCDPRRPLTTADVRDAMDAIADAIGAPRPFDALEGDAPAPRDPRHRDITEDGA